MSEFRIKEWKLEDLRDRKIWIPYMCDAAFIFSAVFRSLGYDSEVLPRSDDPLMSLGRKYTEGDQCLPSIVTTEDILKRVFSKDFNEDKEAFFQGKSQGPCRFGRYYMNQQLILHELGVNSPIFTLDNSNSYSGLSAGAKMKAYDGFVAQSMLERALHFTRPFEIDKGKSEGVYSKYLNEFVKITESKLKGKDKPRIVINTHKKELEEKVKEAYHDFSNIKKRDEKKPVIFVTGEIFVRSSSVANQNLIDKIEQLGGVALLEPVTAFFDYVYLTKYFERKRKLKFTFSSLTDFWKAKADVVYTKRDKSQIEHLFDIAEFPEPSMEEVIKAGKNYVDVSYEGEAIVTLGGSDFFAKHVDGIVNAMPFNCMPGMIVNSKTSELRRNNDNIPFLNLSYDGNVDVSRDERLEIFMYQVKERFKCKNT